MKRKAAEIEENGSVASCSPSSDTSTSSVDSRIHMHGIMPPLLRFNDHINLRTRKRVRDNRPEPNIVHQNTLAKLFDAQRHLGLDRDQPGNRVMTDTRSLSAASESQQRDLHSFFQISHTKSIDMPTKTAKAVVSESGICCEDCGCQLQLHMAADVDGMDIDHDEALFNDDEYRCVDCSRAVCSMCCVRGDYRVCLECALPGGG